jgi:hypothetical protein
LLQIAPGGGLASVGRSGRYRCAAQVGDRPHTTAHRIGFGEAVNAVLVGAFPVTMPVHSIGESTGWSVDRWPTTPSGDQTISTRLNGSRR